MSLILIIINIVNIINIINDINIINIVMFNIDPSSEWRSLHKLAEPPCVYVYCVCVCVYYNRIKMKLVVGLLALCVSTFVLRCM